MKNPTEGGRYARAKDGSMSRTHFTQAAAPMADRSPAAAPDAPAQATPAEPATRKSAVKPKETDQ
jgi:hypothetical protein